MSTPSAQRIAVLLGSGVSCAAGLPSVQVLSDEVAASISVDEAALLQIIKQLTTRTHGAGRDSYEDWYFVADQICQHVDRNFENPALEPVIDFISRSERVFSEVDLANTCRKLCDAITAYVCARLRDTAVDPGSAFVALDVELKRTPSRFALFSLNHDLLLEHFLLANELAFYDGFEAHPETLDFRTFDFSRTAFEKARISVTKLHGSVNWRRYRPLRARAARDKWRDEFFGIRQHENLAFEQMDEIPLVLLGTFNKILQYSTPVFLQMLGEFHHFLRTTSHLIVCGYGFGDKGINTLLTYWMSEKAPRAMYVVDPSPFNKDRCRGAIAQKVDIWKDDGRLRVLPAKVGKRDKSWSDVFQFAQLSKVRL